MGSDEKNSNAIFSVPKCSVSISYEYDPTDVENASQLIAANNEVYNKEKNEDFMTILSGALGQKKKNPHSCWESFRYRN
jgi:hypothetical protein